MVVETDLSIRVSGLSQEPAARLEELTDLRQDINIEIVRLRRRLGMGERPKYHCKRCGYEWKGYHADRPPQRCARCLSLFWDDDDVGPRARTPADPPNPNWKKPMPHDEIRRRNAAGRRKGRGIEFVERPVPTPGNLPMPPGMRKMLEQPGDKVALDAAEKFAKEHLKDEPQPETVGETT